VLPANRASPREDIDVQHVPRVFIIVAYPQDISLSLQFNLMTLMLEKQLQRQSRLQAIIFREVLEKSGKRRLGERLFRHIVDIRHQSVL